MIKGTRRNEFNNNLKNCSARFRSFPGATVKQLKHYVMPTLIDDTPDVIILHGGCNDIKPRDNALMSEQEIAKDLIDIGKVFFRSELSVP